jgi:hypothetical protein
MTPGQWAERYRRAWETADADEVVDLSTPSASYRSSVFRGPFPGSDASLSGLSSRPDSSTECAG